MNPLPHSLSRLRNSGSRWRNVNSAMAGMFERYDMTSTPSGARSPVEMSSGCTVAPRAEIDSGRGCARRDRLGHRRVLGRRLDVRPPRDLDIGSLFLRRRLEDVHVVDVRLEV